MPNNGLRFIAAAAASMLLALSSARAADPALLDAAKRDGEVVWYTTLLVDQAARPLSEGFSKKYPDVKLRFSRASSTDQALKIINEARAGKLQADVFDGSSTIFSLLAADLVAPYKPAAAANFPNDFRDANGTWTALNAYFMVVAYNTKHLAAADVPKTFDDLLNPRLKGKLAWATDESADGPAGFVGLMLKTKGEQEGRAFLRRLAAQNVAQVPANQRVTLDQVITGEYQLGMMVYNHHIALSQAQGAPIEWARIDPALATMNHLGLVRGAPHPNAAKLLIEYLLSEDGQTVLREAGYIPVNPNVSPRNPSLRPDGGRFAYTTFPTATVQEKLPEWNRLFRETFR